MQLGAAMNAAGEPVYVVQDRLTKTAAAYGARTATVSAFPTYLMVTMGRGEPAAVEITTPLSSSPRLDQIAALERLLQDAERGAVRPTDGLRRLAEIRQLHPRFGPLQSIAGYSVLTIGLCLILHPAPRDVAAAAVFGALVGVLRSIGRNQQPLQILMPVIAAFSVSALSALAVKEDLIEPGMRAMVASLIVFLPGTTLTTAVLELAAGQMVSGASRLVSGVVQLALLSFGILAGIEAVGHPLVTGPVRPPRAARCVVAMARRARVRRRRHRRPLGPATVASRRSSSCSTPRGPASSSPTGSSVATSAR